jgi:hypothetical protein
MVAVKRRGLYAGKMEHFSVGPAVMKLTYKILWPYDRYLKQLTSELGVYNIAYIRMAANKSTDSNLLTAGETTYLMEWMRRYFAKQYFLIDPILKFADSSSSYFDWQM